MSALDIDLLGCGVLFVVVFGAWAMIFWSAGYRTGRDDALRLGANVKVSEQ